MLLPFIIYVYSVCLYLLFWGGLRMIIGFLRFLVNLVLCVIVMAVVLLFSYFAIRWLGVEI